MALNPDLVGFVRESLARGVLRPDVEAALLRAGWPPDQVAQALARFADAAGYPIPVPRPSVSVKPREAFLYAVMFAALFVSAFNLGALLFGLIDLAFPHAEDPPEEITRDGIRWAVSMLVVACPVYLYLAAMIRRAVASDPSARASRLRQQLTYVTLFVASCVLIGSVSAVVYNFLDGAVTGRFVVKVLTVGAIAGSAFAHYLRDLRDAETAPAT
jgi:hypothetical protein